MRVLVTGARGFIGSRVAARAVQEGHEVYALTRLPAPLGGPASSRLRPLVADLTHGDEAAQAASKVAPQLCVHLAWFAEPDKYLAHPVNLQHLAGSLRLAEALAQAGCRRFVGAGTCFEYDLRHGWLSEETPVGPQTLYGACKVSLGILLGQLANTSGMRTAWARIFYLYGPGEDPRRLVANVVRGLLAGERVAVTSGEQVRDYLHVDDVASAVWAIATSDVTGPVNVGSGVPVRVRDVVAASAQAAGRPDLVDYGVRTAPEGDPLFVCADIRKLRAATSWQPHYDLHEGIASTVAWWRAAPGGGAVP